MIVTLNGLSKRLVDEGHLQEQQALQALNQANSERVSFINFLLAHKLVKGNIIANTASREFGVPLFDIRAYERDPEVVTLIDEKLIRNCDALPLCKRGNKLFVAISDPANLHALDQFQFQSGLGTVPILAESLVLRQMIEEVLNTQDRSLAELSDTSLEDLEFTGLEKDISTTVTSDSDIDDAPVVRFVNKILLEAISKGASDIHFEPYERKYRVRIRVDGMLVEVASPPVNMGNRICTRLKVMALLDISDRRIPQDGRMKLKLSHNRAIDFRLSTCPTLFGEKLVLRVLDSANLKFGTDMLGMEEEQKNRFLDAIHSSHGMVLITGPTGSGKTVTLYSALSILNTNDKNISTAEDPAEIYLPGVNQVNINPRVGLSFATALRAFLRQDPDIIMVGEIRDTETAEIAMKAAQTGHMVLSTLHTNNAPQTLTRLMNMGIEPYNIVASVKMIVAQRLARQLCNHCKQPLDLPDEILLRHGFKLEEIDSFTLYGPAGCSQCNAGYRDRVGIFEVMPVSDAIAKVIINGGNSIQIAEQAQKEGYWSLRWAGLEKVKAGLTSLEEINRVISE